MNFKSSLIVISGLLAAALGYVLPARATVMGVYPGDLIKLQNDHDPATHEDEVVYYFDRDWHRRPFPNVKVFHSWFRDFTGVKELSRTDMAEIIMGSPVVYRPGTRLVKIPSVPKTYAVEPGGVLRWIESEAIAKALYGDNWAQRVDDVDESFFTGYTEGAPLVTATWPTGTILRRDSDASLFLIDGIFKHHLPTTAMATFRYDAADVIETTDDLSRYADSGAVSLTDPRLGDAGQISRLETQAPPQVDFPANIATAGRAADQTLAAFRLTAGAPITLRGVSVRLSGQLWNGSTPALKDIRIVDVYGVNLFGTKQLTNVGAGEETLSFAGSYALEANTTKIIELKADTVGLPVGSQVTVSWVRDGFKLYDFSRGDVLTDFFSPAFQPSTVKVD